MIITFVLCYELISMLMEKNNFHDFETFALYKWILKVFVAVYLVTHTFDITMAIFELAQNVVQQSAGVITGTTSIDFAAALGDVATQLEAMEIGELFGLLVETMLLKITMPVLSFCVMLVLIWASIRRWKPYSRISAVLWTIQKRALKRWKPSDTNSAARAGI